MENDHKKNNPVIGISIGDINGIGPEVVIKALNNGKMTKYFTPVIYGSAKTLTYYRKQLNFEQFNFSPIDNISQVHQRKVNVVNCWEESIEVHPGIINETGGKCAFKALEKATEDLVARKIDALVTAPINKHNIQNETFKFPGHTEYLIEMAGAKDGLMFLISDTLRIGVLTGHIPLKEVASQVTKEAIEKKLKIMNDCLKKDFGIGKPKIAVLGLNPHAGEEGLLGMEEIEIIKPALAAAKERGQLVMGPFPADGFFGSGQFNKFDGILAMYHDQGLIPFKNIAFSTGVNFTAGLPFIRTSPDHGTAYSIAGQDKADENSMRAALFMALDIVNQRSEAH